MLITHVNAKGKTVAMEMSLMSANHTIWTICFGAIRDISIATVIPLSRLLMIEPK